MNIFICIIHSIERLHCNVLSPKVDGVGVDERDVSLRLPQFVLGVWTKPLQG